jgi:hypothetical protein
MNTGLLRLMEVVPSVVIQLQRLLTVLQALVVQVLVVAEVVLVAVLVNY